MSDEQPPGLLDRLVDLAARSLDALGLNGTRLRWKWNQKRRSLAEAGARGEQMLRASKGKHKMCRSCRALMARSASTCTECGATMRDVQAPGSGRTVSNLLPGMSSAASLIMLVNGFWFMMMMMAQMKAGGMGGGLFGGFSSELTVQFGSGLSEPRLLSSGAVTGGEWWRIVTPIFLHGGMMHFAFNSYLLLQLGPMVEELWGTERFWVIYLACGLAGSATSQLPRFVNTVGASGAIMGLIGLLAVYGWRHGSVLGGSIKQLLFRLVAYSVILSLVFGGIDHFNHAGGLACGALLGWLVPAQRLRDPERPLLWQILSIAGVGLVLLAFYKVAMFARDTATL